MISGLGLMGGSMAKAIRAKGFDGTLIGHDSAEESCQLAHQSGLFTQITTNMSIKLNTVPDLVVLAGPPQSMPAQLDALIAAGAIGRTTLVTDLGSVKAPIHQALTPKLKALQIQGSGPIFIGGHPMAGAETSGFKHARAELFQGASYCLTTDALQGEGQPQREVVSKGEGHPRISGGEAHHVANELERLSTFVKLLGAKPILVDATSHDAYVACTSHLPHVAASALAGALASLSVEACQPFIGSGLRDTTRLALGDPELWRQILSLNAIPVAEAIERLMAELKDMKALLKQGDQGGIKGQLIRGQQLRRQWTEVTCPETNIMTTHIEETTIKEMRQDT